MASVVITKTDTRTLVANTVTTIFDLVAQPVDWNWFPRLLVINREQTEPAMPVITAVVQLKPLGQASWFDAEDMVLPQRPRIMRFQPMVVLGPGDACRVTLRSSSPVSVKSLLIILAEQADKNYPKPTSLPA